MMSQMRAVVNGISSIELRLDNIGGLIKDRQRHLSQKISSIRGWVLVGYLD